MILTLIGILILYLTFLRFLVAMVNMLSRPYLPELQPDYGPLPSLSVLIPVRNEEKNIGTLLGTLTALPYKNAEILVYDDGSTDGSALVIDGYVRCDSRVRYLRGSDLPDGWTGKNRACHNLAEEAKGEYLLFLDADVIVRNDLLRRAVSYAVKHDLTLLSMFPGQVMKTKGEKIVVPFMFRMYRSYSEGINGFSRNIFSMFSNSALFFLLYSLTGLAGWIVLIFLPWYFLASYLFMVVSLNAMIAVTSGQKATHSIRWLLPGIAAFYHIAFLAIARTAGRSYEWKGRKVK